MGTGGVPAPRKEKIMRIQYWGTAAAEAYPAMFCTCEACRNDIIAYALNQLPPKYVATRKGEVYSKTFILRNQHYADIMAALAKGAKVVSDHPRHDPR